MVIGNIRKYINNRIVFEWTIPEFFNLSRAMGGVYLSPKFYCFQNQWDLELCTNGCMYSWDEDWIVIGLWRGSETGGWSRMIGLESLESPLRYTVGIKKAEGVEWEILSDRIVRNTTGSSGENQFVRWSNLLRSRSQLAPSNALTITCTLWSTKLPSVDEGTVVSRETQTEDLRDEDGEEDVAHLSTKGEIVQQKHFKDMLLEGQDHDVTLKVEDQEFRAHKCVLRARSPVFAAMFTHNMKEAECGDVTIEDCNPTAFGEFLQYVYTGKVDFTPSNALGLYYVGDKYDFPDLKEMCVEFLKISLSTTVVSDVITMAMKHGEEELLDCAIAFFTDHLTEILPTVEWQRFNKHNHALANELTVKAMKSYKKVG